MNLQIISKEKFLAVSVNRLAIFFFLLNLLTLFLYAAGSYQEFIHTTQFFLLYFCAVLSVPLIVASASGFILDLYRFSKTGKKRYLARAGGYLFLVIFGAVTLFAANAVLAVSGGNPVVRGLGEGRN